MVPRSHSTGTGKIKTEGTGEITRRVSWSPEVLRRELEVGASVLDELEQLDAESIPTQDHSLQKASKKNKKIKSPKAPDVPQSLDDGDAMYFL